MFTLCAHFPLRMPQIPWQYRVSTFWNVVVVAVAVYFWLTETSTCSQCKTALHNSPPLRTTFKTVHAWCIQIWFTPPVRWNEGSEYEKSFVHSPSQSLYLVSGVSFETSSSGHERSRYPGGEGRWRSVLQEGICISRLVNDRRCF